MAENRFVHCWCCPATSTFTLYARGEFDVCRRGWSLLHGLAFVACFVDVCRRG
ncbi:hypothetical protein [Streptomyces sp. NPDC017988]|uniref:hypothetical protein n=1 Tax=Streptomyces sp. NPDC017988 TaxID=3365025 RepID=UPI0037AD4755